MKTAFFIALKLAISVALMWLIFREHHFSEEILPHLKALLSNWHWTLAGLACMGISTWFSSLRWEWLLRGQDQPVTGGQVLRITVVSQFFNLTSLGTTGGDAYRIMSMLRQRGTSRLPVVVSVVLDHMVGAAGLSILFLVSSVAFQEKWDSYPPEMRMLVKGFTICMAVGLAGIISCVFLFAPRLYNWGETWLPLLRWSPLKQFAQACDGARVRWGCSLIALVLSVAIFFFHFMAFYCGIYAVNATAPLIEVMAAMPIVDTAAGLPLSISGLGVREKTFETLMHGLSGIPQATAVSASLAGWLMGVVWGLLGGLLFIKGAPSPKMVEEPAADQKLSA